MSFRASVAAKRQDQSGGDHVQNGPDHPPSSRTSDELGRRHPTLTGCLFGLAALIWPLIVYAAYLCVACRALSPP